MLNGVTCIVCHNNRYENSEDCPKCHGSKHECASCGAGWDVVNESCTREGCSSYKLNLEKDKK